MSLIPFPQYGLTQYGLYQYGRYELSSGSDYRPGAEPRMRIRLRTADGGIGLWVETQMLEQSLPGKFPQVRIKTNSGDWVYMQSATLPKHAAKVRMRVRTTDNTPHDWVLYEEARIE